MLPNKRLQLAARGLRIAADVAVGRPRFARAKAASQRAAGRCKVAHGGRQLSRNPLEGAKRDQRRTRPAQYPGLR